VLVNANAIADESNVDIIEIDADPYAVTRIGDMRRGCSCSHLAKYNIYIIGGEVHMLSRIARGNALGD
jgi:DNA polymerase III gamma/tau subunit